MRKQINIRFIWGSAVTLRYVTSRSGLTGRVRDHQSVMSFNHIITGLLATGGEISIHDQHPVSLEPCTSATHTFLSHVSTRENVHAARRRAHVSRRTKHGGITTSFPPAFTAFGSRQRSLLTKQLHDQCCAMKQYPPWFWDGRSTGLLLLWVFIEQPDTGILSWERDSVNKGRERCRNKKENRIPLLLSCGDYIRNYVCRGVSPPPLLPTWTDMR